MAVITPSLSSQSKLKKAKEKVDRKDKARVPMSARVVADTIQLYTYKAKTFLEKHANVTCSHHFYFMFSYLIIKL